MWWGSYPPLVALGAQRTFLAHTPWAVGAKIFSPLRTNGAPVLAPPRTASRRGGHFFPSYSASALSTLRALASAAVAARSASGAGMSPLSAR